MKQKVDHKALASWVDRALASPTTYFRVRRDLFEGFTSLLANEGTVMVPSALIVAVRSFCLSRNDALTPDKQLAFDTALLELARLADDVFDVLDMSEPSQAPSVTSGPSQGRG